MKSVTTTSTLPTRIHVALRTSLIMAALSGCAGVSSLPDARDGTPANVAGAELTVITPALVHQQSAGKDAQAEPGIADLLSKVYAPYQLGSGDILSIVLWGHNELASSSVGGDDIPSSVNTTADFSGPAGFVIDERGAITYPYIGEVKVEGLTVEQARELIATRLNRYIKRPNVVVRVRSYRSKRIYVDGELKTPGLLTIDDIPMSLVEAVNRAGGLLPAADQSQIRLTRADVTYVIDLPGLIRKGINPTRLVLVNGDVLRVPSRDESKVFVSGEVNAPQAIAMHDGRLSLSEAIGVSGGINPVSGNPRQVYVIRKATPGPRVFLLDARDPSAFAMAEEFMLAPKDVVYVASTPLTNWHRTISSLLPSALSSAVGAVGTRP
jgi:polysaccharide export outer membrane protein